jgi:hypothetical protein
MSSKRKREHDTTRALHRIMVDCARRMRQAIQCPEDVYCDPEHDGYRAALDAIDTATL